MHRNKISIFKGVPLPFCAPRLIRMHRPQSPWRCASAALHASCMLGQVFFASGFDGVAGYFQLSGN